MNEKKHRHLEEITFNNYIEKEVKIYIEKNYNDIFQYEFDSLDEYIEKGPILFNGN
jgi:CTP:phosphocholine cytidylyltransferase-like protein